MSFIPAKRQCDLCQCDLNPERPHPVMFYPFTQTEAEQLMEQFAERFPEPARMLGSMTTIAIPPGTRLDFCTGCVDGFMPMLDAMREGAFNRILTRLAARASGQDKNARRRALDDEDL